MSLCVVHVRYAYGTVVSVVRGLSHGVAIRAIAIDVACPAIGRRCNVDVMTLSLERSRQNPGDRHVDTLTVRVHYGAAQSLTWHPWLQCHDILLVVMSL